MDKVETDLLHPMKDQNLINEYFNLTIKKELNIDINVSNEYVIAQNIVSKKLILVKTFSEAIMINPDLYLLLQSLIQKINTGNLGKGQLLRAIESRKDN
nr:hypothetical protein [uncultured Chryseobacterium sp.]